MRKLEVKFLKAMRLLYSKWNPQSVHVGRKWNMFSAKEYANSLIAEHLLSDKPCMIARFGAIEISVLINYLGVKKDVRNGLSFIKGEVPEWWWNEKLLHSFKMNAGFFPVTIENVERFCDLILRDIPKVDILGSWLKEEQRFAEDLTKASQVVLEDLEPFFTPNPWTWALEGMKVLVVHPFASTIESQYQKRDVLFKNQLLPDFDLKTIKAVQSSANEKTNFSDWFQALDYMKRKIDSTDYDVCILGCGAYGFPLAAHVKRMGKKAVHLGGITQMLFGIKGRRWENFEVWPYQNLFNEHWIRPGENEMPVHAKLVEDACYW